MTDKSPTLPEQCPVTMKFDPPVTFSARHIEMFVVALSGTTNVDPICVNVAVPPVTVGAWCTGAVPLNADTSTTIVSPLTGSVTKAGHTADDDVTTAFCWTSLIAMNQTIRPRPHEKGALTT